MKSRRGLEVKRTKSSSELLGARGRRALREKMDRITCCRGASAAISSLSVFSDVYNLTKQIDRGSYSTVWEATHRNTGQRYAVKIINRKKLVTAEQDPGVYHEVNILRYLDQIHCNEHLQDNSNNKQQNRGRRRLRCRCQRNIRHIVRLVDFFEEVGKFYLVMELMRGGDVFSRVMDRQFYTEQNARSFARRLLEAVRYMHKNGVAHRDIKPDNILLPRRGSDTEIKIGDFGFATNVKNEKGDKIFLTDRCGTPAYVAPEILRGIPYDESADMWSVGAVLYFVLGGYPPFVGNSPKSLFRKILAGDYEFHDEDWCHVSEEAKDLIRALLIVDPSKRLTAQEALKNPWVVGSGDEENLNSNDKVQDDNTQKPLLKGMKQAQRKLKEVFHEAKISPDSDSSERQKGNERLNESSKSTSSNRIGSLSNNMNLVEI